MGYVILVVPRFYNRFLVKYQSLTPRQLKQVLHVYYQLLQTSPFSVMLLPS